MVSAKQKKAILKQRKLRRAAAKKEREAKDAREEEAERRFQQELRMGSAGKGGDGESHGAASTTESTTGVSGVATSFGGKRQRESKRNDVDSSLASIFEKETDEAVSQRRRRGALPLASQNAESCTAEAWFGDIGHPRRPDFAETLQESSSTSEALAAAENDCVGAWIAQVRKVRASCRRDGGVFPFEMNFRVWRQLWRVLEGSDVVILCADARNPTAHTPPSLVEDVVQFRGKPLIIVLTKVEIVPENHVMAWKRYLEDAYPRVAAVLPFSTFPGGFPPPAKDKDVPDGFTNPWREVCAKEGGRGGVASRRKKYKKARSSRKHYASAVNRAVERILSAAVSASTGLGDRRGDGSIIDDRVRIGLIGHPNAGKTSLLNAIVGKVVASASRTAGRTKHMQHIVLERVCGIKEDDASHLSQLRRSCVLMDCPGIIFASLQPRHVSEVHGFVPVAQIREALSSVRYLAERIDLPRVYGLAFPDWTEADDGNWTPRIILETLAEKKKYHLSRSGALDVHRAGLEIVRDAADGVIPWWLSPPHSM